MNIAISRGALRRGAAHMRASFPVSVPDFILHGTVYGSNDISPAFSAITWMTRTGQ
jgi:hypothetical protein